MSAFETATKFFETCEAPLGWEACAEFVQDGATFNAQSEPIADIDTVQAYADWMHGFGTVTSPEGSYELHSSSFDENTQTDLGWFTFSEPGAWKTPEVSQDLWELPNRSLFYPHNP